MNQDILRQFVELFTLTDAAATQRVSERLQLVLRSPGAYQEQFAAELEERGIIAQLPAQELRDLALIDALLGEDLAWECDWKETAAEMAEGISEVLVRQQRQPLLANRLAGGRSQGPEALDALQDALEAQKLALVLLTLDSDSYPLGVVAEAQVEQARSLARQLGFELVAY